MDSLKSSSLPRGFVISDTYTVIFSIKSSDRTSTYRVKGKDGQLYFLKLFNTNKLNRTDFDKSNKLREIEIASSLQDSTIIPYITSGELIYNSTRYAYMIQGFVVGETLAARIRREQISTLYDVKQIACDLLTSLEYLHNRHNIIVHNQINPNHIILDLSTKQIKAFVTDYRYARSFLEPSSVFNRDDLDMSYVASECFNKLYCPQSDLYSIGAIMYKLLYGRIPWQEEFSTEGITGHQKDSFILKARSRPLQFPAVLNQIVDFDPSINDILLKALNHNLDIRFKSATEFKDALAGSVVINSESNALIKIDNYENNTENEVKKGMGFSAIAGMENLKEQLTHDVINVIKNADEYRRHNLGMPNGMLLYGPPGCGKTFFAERFAEETGYNFIKVVASDVASIYVHGTQEKIGRLFGDAKKSAPCILYFDEMDAMVPSRENVQNNSQSGEVNEFLSQLDNIGNSGVFVIGSTNKPDLIDQAILRSGRLEKWFYIPPPDYEARRSLFELYLKDRPIDLGIDYDKLSNLTENYVSSDIKFLVDESSRKTIKDKSKRISMDTLESVINLQRPTVKISELRKYEILRKKIESGLDENSSERPRIGFK